MPKAERLARALAAAEETLYQMQFRLKRLSDRAESPTDADLIAARQSCEVLLALYRRAIEISQEVP